MIDKESRVKKYDGSGIPPQSHRMIEPKGRGSTQQVEPQRQTLMSPIANFLISKGYGWATSPFMASLLAFLALCLIIFFYQQGMGIFDFVSGNVPNYNFKSFMNFFWNIFSIFLGIWIFWRFIIKKRLSGK